MRPNWDRMAASTGVAFAVVILVAFFTYGESPSLGATASEKATFFTDHRGRILTAMVLASIALLLFLWFAGTLAATMRDAGEPRLAAVLLAGAAVMTAGIFGFIVLAAALASSVAKTADVGVSAALYDLATTADVVVSFPAALVAAAVAIASLRSHVFPAWFGWASLAGAAAFLSAGTVWATDGFWAPDGAWTTITFLAFLGWTAITSGLLVARGYPAESSTPARVAGAH